MSKANLFCIPVQRNYLIWLISLWIGVSLAIGLAGVQPSSAKAEAAAENSSVQSPSSPAIPLCNGVTAIPESECNALIALYLSTDGAHWLDQTNWLTINATLSPCNWHGVVCEAGHVVQLALVGNQLRGPLPRTLGNFTQLTHLLLANNQLRGYMPLTICLLVSHVQVASFDYNQLIADNRRVKACLDALEPTWVNTQNVPPTSLRVSQITTTTIALHWTPIVYTGDGGYYEISTATTITGTFTLHGHTVDKTIDHYLLDRLTPGQTYYIRVRTYTPTPNGQPGDPFSEGNRIPAVTQAITGKVLVIAYLPMDNDLSPYVPSILHRFQIGTALNGNVQVVALVDQQGDHNTNLFEIDHGQITPTNTVQTQWGKDELNTMDPKVLAWFLKYARTQYPATRTIVALMGHGAGLTPEADPPPTNLAQADALSPAGIPALPQGLPATPGDITNQGGYLSTTGIAQALAAATDNGANPFDVVFFDQCFQGNLDVLYEVRNAARVFIASPNYAWLVAAYQKYLPQFTPDATPEAMANAIIYLYQASLTDQEPNVIFWVRSADITAIENAVSQLGLTLQSATQGGADNQILAAARGSQYVDTTQCGRGNMKLGPPDELLGAGSFARNLQHTFVVNDAFGVRAAADNVLATLANVHSLARTGSPYIEPDAFWDYADTLTLLAPLQRDITPKEMLTRKIWRASIYTSTVPLDAAWAPTLTMQVPITSSFASTRDGQWDDFIGHWYTNRLAPTLGEWCHYMPPPLVTSDITETLELTVTPVNHTLQFSWSATNNDAATAYWILTRKSDNRNWLVLDSVPITQTTYAVLQPRAGANYQFAVIAEDEDGLVVAQAAAITYAAPASGIRLYLPYVQR
ncbi:MAG: clostripain-related cysteine peptidase [Caldilineaceae bacterium]